MKRVLFAAAVVLSTSCADGNSIISPPEAPLKSASDAQGLTVTAQTFGPNGSLWTVTGGYTLCENYWTDIVWQGRTVGVEMKVNCAPSEFSSYEVKTYDGGIVNILVESDNGYVAQGWVSADLGREGNTFNVPSGAAVRLQASLNPGCELSYWNTDGGGFTGNPLDIPASSNIGNVQANFYCS